MCGFHCPYEGSPGWPDWCPQKGNDTGVGGTNLPCTPWEPLWHGGSTPEWELQREELIAKLWGIGGAPPTRAVPDVGPEPYNDPVVFGNCLCLLRGECQLDDCSAVINATTFKWNISVYVNSSYGSVDLQSKVFHSLNTSGVAVANQVSFRKDEPFIPTGEFPEVTIFPQNLSENLVIVHDGHTVTNRCPFDVQGDIDFLNQLGYDVMHIQMPFHGCNAEDPRFPLGHGWFEQFAGYHGNNSDQFPFMRFFVEPVWLTINYAKKLGYKRIVMTGLSGGGFTTTISAAIDPRIGLSLPVAGSIPCDFAHTSWDFEQLCDQPWSKIANYTSLYVLGALERERSQIQILHEWDNCCFHGCGRHARIRDYNKFVRASSHGQFVTSVTQGNIHEINPRDRMIIGYAIDTWLRNGGRLTEEDMRRIPFTLTPLA